MDYLSLVNAISEGKQLEYFGKDGTWRVSNLPEEMLLGDVSEAPGYYRIKLTGEDND